MQVKRLLLLLFCISTVAAFAQNKQDYVARFKQLDTLILKQGNTDLTKVFPLINEQIAIADQLNNDSMLYRAHYFKGEALSFLGIYDASLEVQYAMLKKMEKEPKAIRRGETLYDIGYNYQKLDDRANALKFFRQAKTEFHDFKRYDDELKADIEIGNMLAKMGQFEEGTNILKASVDEMLKNGPSESLLNGYELLSLLYLDKGDYQEALKYRNETLKYDEIIESAPSLSIAKNLQFGMIYTGMKDYAKATSYLDKAIATANEYGTTEALVECYEYQSKIAEGQGNYKAALLAHQQYKSLKDSIYKKDYDTKISVMANLYELDKKQSEIQKLAQEQELKSAKIQRLYVAIVALLLAATALLMFVLYSRKKAEAQMRMQFSTQLLDAQENERQRISKELHDSVGQNILFIKNQVFKLFADGNPSLSKSVDDALEEVRNISKDLYPNQLEQYGLVSAIDELCEKVKEATSIFISSDVQVPEKSLSKSTKINCYRIIQECINNTLKHAAASAIRVTAEMKEGAILLIVQDNGKGFDRSTLKSKANSSFGMLNLQERVRLLNGRFDLETTPGNGTKSTFLIPIA